MEYTTPVINAMIVSLHTIAYTNTFNLILDAFIIQRFLCLLESNFYQDLSAKKSFVGVI